LRDTYQKVNNFNLLVEILTHRDLGFNSYLDFHREIQGEIHRVEGEK
jgi:hypothetical protein